MPAEGGSEHTGRTALALRDALSWHDTTEVVRTAEETGYECLFVPEITGREAFSTLAGFALATERILVGTGVVTVLSRTPMVTAMAAATVQEVARGRMVLGIGAGALRPVAAGHRGPVAVVRAYVAAVRDLLTGRRVEAPEFGLRAANLHPAFEAAPPPIWLGALGDRMIELSGEVADGVILNWCTPERVGRAKGVLTRAATGAGRDPGDVTVAVYVRASLGVEETAALDALRGMAGQYATYPRYLEQFRAMGMGAMAERATSAVRAGRPGDVPEELVRAVAVVGGRREALARFEAYRQAGADLVVCYPVAALEPLSSILGTVLAAAPSPVVER